MSTLSLASHFDLYPLLLFPSLVMLIASVRERNCQQSASSLYLSSLLTVSLHSGFLLLLGRWLIGSWSFISGIYGCILSVCDLRPTLSLHWYLFIEMFNHFRSFFLTVFQLHVIGYVAPICIKFRNQPFFATVFLFSLISVFKSFPAVGDTGLWMSLLWGCFPYLNSYTKSLLLPILFMLAACLLLPTFHYLWLYSGSGNANFYYASTQVWCVGEMGVLAAWAWAAARAEWEQARWGSAGNADIKARKGTTVHR